MSNSAPTTPSPPTGVWRAGRRIAWYRRSRYLPGGMAWATNHTLPLVTGLLLKAVFDALSRHRPATSSALSLLAVLLVAELARAGVFWTAMAGWPSWWQAVAAWLRANTLAAVLVSPGPPSERLPGSAGEAISRFRDDVEDLVWFVDVWVDVAGGIVFTAAALAIMFSISPVISLMVVLPLIGVMAGTRGLSHVIRSYHQRMRESGGSVTDLVADLFAGVLTIKASGAEERAVARLRARNDTRRTAAVRAQLARDLINTVSGVSVSITTGLVLLLAAGAMRAGRFSVGDLALFMSYSDALTGLPRWAGRMLARQREAGVALNRLGRMQPGRRPEAVLAPRPVYLRSEPPPASPAPSVLPRLALLEARALRAAHPSGRGVFDVELSVAAGGLTVITGAVGSGKTTLLRALLGLVPLDGGTVTWNGVPIEDLGAGLSPPRAAYVAQIPRLISAPLLENLLLGWTPMTEGVDEAIASVQLGPDLAEMTQGLQTTIGPRGSRLSGGQAQRVAIARSLVRRPDLLVIDDISSALDPPTEAAVWESLRRQGCACLVVSHRRYALDAADLVVVLDRGHQVGAGTFVELSDHPELRRLGMFAPSTPTGVPEA
ncbi:MAG TPA: ABC transporter ATP-binding protein [Acidimicrobiales bacterium]|nr:ABC transporter ATP-binding protein [Acidimicrobiales bacterium]